VPQSATLLPTSSRVIAWPSASPIASPFGSSLPNRAWSDVSRGYRYGFNTQEKDNEIAGEGNSYTAEFWQYDGRLGRRFNIDPKSDISISEYACFGNNPIYFTDHYGDTLDFSRINKSNKAASEKTLNEWMEQSGLKISVNERGKVEYDKDKNGKPLVTNVAGKEIGSKKMRRILIKAIERKKTVYFESDAKEDGSYYSWRWDAEYEKETKKKRKEYFINLDDKQTEMFKDNFVDSKNKMTFSYGLIAFHELLHWHKGTSDPRSQSNHNPGRTEKICNRVRRQLGYTEFRYSYNVFEIDGKWYIPFSKDAYQKLSKGETPTNQPMIILTPPPTPAPMPGTK
jgi:hypothetical protein